MKILLKVQHLIIEYPCKFKKEGAKGCPLEGVASHNDNC